MTLRQQFEKETTHMAMMRQLDYIIWLEDKLNTKPTKANCNAVKRADGKCIRGRNKAHFMMVQITNKLDNDIMFDIFWSQYPRRNGKKLGKIETKKVFARCKTGDLEQIIIAVKNYSQSQQVKSGFAKDPVRFVRNDYWKDWLDGAGETQTKQTTEVAEQKRQKQIEAMK